MPSSCSKCGRPVDKERFCAHCGADLRYSPSRGWLAAAAAWTLVNLYQVGPEYARYHPGSSTTRGWIIVAWGSVFWATVLRLGYLSIFRRGPWLLRRTFLSPWCLFLVGTVAISSFLLFVVREA